MRRLHLKPGVGLFFLLLPWLGNDESGLPHGSVRGSAAGFAPRHPAAGGPRDCAQCHAAVAQSGHPTGVRVTRIVDLPLGPGGTVVCTTCHVETDHADGDGGERSTTAVRTTLRRKPRELCATCHRASANEKSGLFHALASGRAHATASGGTIDGRNGGFLGSEIDEQSRQCLSCHDGSAARPASGVADNSTVGHQFGHVSAETYREAQRRPGRQLRPEGTLPPQVLLVDGRVGCSSCHSPWSRRPQMLNLPMQGSLLCRACHDM